MAQSAPALARDAVVLLGAGDQASETTGYCRDSGISVIAYVVESGDWGSPHGDLVAPVHDFDTVPAEWLGIAALTCVGSPEVRRRLAGRWPGPSWLTLISPRAWVADGVSLGRGTTVSPFTTVNRGAQLGEHVQVQPGVVVSHDCRIEDYATLSAGSMLGGHVRVGAGATLGLGAVVRDRVVIGEGAMVGAGAVVVKDVPPGQTVVGVPASPLRRVAQS